MITITQPQIDAICWAAERHVRSLKRSGSDHEQEIKEIRGWIEALKGRESCELSFLRLTHLLGLFKLKEFRITDKDISTAEERSRMKMVVEELAKRTERLDQVICEANNLLPNGIDIIQSLKRLKSIGTFCFDRTRVGFKILALVATLPIQRLRTFSDWVEQDVIMFIRENNTVQNLEIRPYFGHVLPGDTFNEALQANRTLKVCSLFFRALFICQTVAINTSFELTANLVDTLANHSTLQRLSLEIFLKDIENPEIAAKNLGTF